MLSWKSIWVSPLVSLVLLSTVACNSLPERPSYRGIPKEPVPRSFKIELAPSSMGSDHDEKILKTKADEVAASVGCEVDSLQPIAWATDATPSSLSGAYHLSFKGCELSEAKLDETLTAFSEEPSVNAVEAEAFVRVTALENDPGKAQQVYLKAIDRDAACDKLQATTPEVVVAVIDSGVDMNHPDLMNNFKRDAKGAVIGANFVGKGSRSEPDLNWDDQNGHGTHVAGIIAAQSNNKIGISGVAGCAKVKIMPVRVMNASGIGSSIEIDRGIQWAVSHGADVINLSLGSNSTFRTPRTQHPNAIYADAAARGVAVFAAAGNDGITLGAGKGGYVYSYPASYDNVVSVAALDSRNALASFSNRGETVDIAAPGVDILSTYKGETYSKLSGTSMASPVAAGSYALALSTVRTSDKHAPANLEALLKKAVKMASLRTSDVTSGGVINIVSLIDLMKPEPDTKLPTPKPAPAPSPSPAPAPTPAPEDDLPGINFGSIESGMVWSKAAAIQVQNWPKDKTATINLYWVTKKNPRPYAFITLDRRNLSADGSEVVTKSNYMLYGQGTLVAEALDAQGRVIETAKVAIQGL